MDQTKAITRHTAGRRVIRRRPPKSDQQALDRFASLLSVRGIRFWDEDHLTEEITLQKDKKFDFLVRHKIHGDAFIEIESFEKPSLALAGLRMNGVMSVHHIDETRVRTAVRGGSKQLKPYRINLRPMIVILDDFREVGISSAVDCLGLTLSQYFHDHASDTYLSAVAWLCFRDETHVSLRIFHNPNAAHPVPDGMFHDWGDEHFFQEPGQFWKRG